MRKEAALKRYAENMKKRAEALVKFKSDVKALKAMKALNEKVTDFKAAFKAAFIAAEAAEKHASYEINWENRVWKDKSTGKDAEFHAYIPTKLLLRALQDLTQEVNEYRKEKVKNENEKKKKEYEKKMKEDPIFRELEKKKEELKKMRKKENNRRGVLRNHGHNVDRWGRVVRSVRGQNGYVTRYEGLPRDRYGRVVNINEYTKQWEKQATKN